MRTEAELILKSRKVTPERLLESGFEFKFAEAEQLVTGLLDADA